MQSLKIVVLDGVPLNPGDLSWKTLEELGEVTIYDRTPVDQVSERIKEADVVFTNKVKLRAEHLESAPNLKFIGEMATGFDNIEVAAARAKGIPVSNVPSYSSGFTAQTAIALLLALCHRVEAHAQAVKAGDWVASPDFSFWKHPLVELDGKTLVVIGLGTIGCKVAKIAESLGMRVIAGQVPGRTYDSDSPHLPLAQALPMADVVSLHCPLKPETRGMVNSEFLGQMKPSALLINTARGGVIDEAALAQALAEEKIAGFAGDVLSVEPPSADNPLLSVENPNCLITPHIGWASPEARARCLETCVANLKAFLAGEPQNVVN